MLIMFLPLRRRLLFQIKNMQKEMIKPREQLTLEVREREREREREN